jgi:tetratricopeptide (TPR) repeat protein
MYPRVFVFACAVLTLGAQTTPKEWYEQGHRYSELSVQSFERLLKTAPESGYVLALLGEVKEKERQYTAAIYAFSEAAKRTPRLRGVRSGLAGVYRAMGKLDEASAAEKQEQQLGNPDCAIEKLYCDYAAGKYDHVVATAKTSRTPEGLYWLSRAYNELAINALAKLSEFPDSAEIHRVKAETLHDAGKFREAVDEWRQVLKVTPEDRDAEHHLATDLYMSGDVANALPELKQFLEAEPNSANLNFFVGDSLLQREQIEAAIPYLQNAVKFDPTLLPAQASLGLCYARVREPNKAIPHLKAALGIDNDGSLHYQLARAYQATGQPALAKVMMDKYQQLRKASGTTAPAP